MAEWAFQRSFSECHAIMSAPGNTHEMETCLVDGRLQRVYKNIWPSLRAFWRQVTEKHAGAVYVVFENQRYTFAQIFDESVKAASLYRNRFGIQKGDRIAICSRNYPQYLVAFWACHLIGAVSVLVNAWLPMNVLEHCFRYTGCKLVILDAERADRIEPIVERLISDPGSKGFLVLDPHEGRGQWQGMQPWQATLDEYQFDRREILDDNLEIVLEDNATIYFTSGTTGVPKGVLGTQRMYLTNAINISVAMTRANLRQGGSLLPNPPPTPAPGILIPVPLFHVTGSTSMMMLACLIGMKIVFMRKWVPEEAARLIKRENVRMAGGVPSMVSDLTEASQVQGFSLDSLFFGGAPAPSSLAARAGRAFQTALMSQGYGLTETNSVAVSFAGADYVTRPESCGLPTPVNDVIIMNGTTSVPPGEVGEVWIRGPNVMKEYWRDPEATEKVLTKDGWFKTGDLGYLDKEGFLYIRDRIKDIIIRGGENIDSVSVENALYKDPKILEAAAVGVPHARLGEVVAAVVSVKPAFKGQLTEASLIGTASESLPKYAVPVMIVIQDELLPRNEAGKILKGDLRKVARAAWEAKLKEESAGRVETKL